MLESKSILLPSFFTWLIATISSFIFLSLFSFFYDKFLNPPQAGYGLFYGRSEELIVGGIIFAYNFFLPLYILIFVPKKQWLVWIILIFVPFTITLSGGSKHIFWFLVFTIAGGIIGWCLNYVINKRKTKIVKSVSKNERQKLVRKKIGKI